MNLRLVLISILAALPLIAQPPCTQITDTRYDITSTVPAPWNGTILVSLGYVIAPTDPSTVEIPVATGQISICLPAGNYTAAYSIKRLAPLTGSANTVHYWQMPATGGPYTIQQVEVQGPITPTLSIAPAQITASGVSDGTYCVQVTGQVVTGFVVCSGGSSYLFDSAPGLFDSASGLFDSL